MIPGHFNLERVVRTAQLPLTTVRHIAHELLELVCPPDCAVCDHAISDNKDVLCTQCWGLLRENLQDRPCPTCGHNVGPYSLIDGRCHRCQGRRAAVSSVVRVGNYDGILRALILMFKFAGRSHLDEFLGGMLADALLGAEYICQPDLLVPIPLHWRRRWKRKYNQAELLAQALANRLKYHDRAIPVDCNLLRVRYTEPQTSLAPSHRLTNLAGAFAVRPDCGYQGKHICLIDDVTTTGTTLRVAARTILNAGAARVSAAVLAVAAND